MPASGPPSSQDASTERHTRGEAVRSIDSDSLLGREGRLIIHHEGRRYVLRRTRLGKLILTA
ncbi:hemin uptake protein HemP [Halomonas sp. I1]|uniref:hemin uptake protein HemP n=1 Tax=Halomonas sp. I1 TaxID=393536 RepID=UPI0028DDC455|nr:hemin uptake protein HemP [Halomonas sp. I1]MDT8893886.1 hemin uptake protein HemP [Halomonas sp. I1]